MKSFRLLLLCPVVALLCSCGGSKGDDVVFAVNTGDGISYFTDSKGSLLFSAQFEGVMPFHEGLALVEQNSKSGFINTKGEVVIPCIYYYADSFSDGFTKVWQNNLTTVINTKGEAVIAGIESEEIYWSRVKL